MISLRCSQKKDIYCKFLCSSSAHIWKFPSAATSLWFERNFSWIQERNTIFFGTFQHWGGMFFYYYYRTHQNIREWSNTRGMHILRYYFWAIHPPPPPTGFSFSPQEELLGWDSNSTSGMLHSSRSAGVIKWAGRKPRLRWLCADRTSMRPFLLAVLRLNNAFLSALTTVVIKAKTNFYRRTRVVLGREFVYFRDKGFSGLFLSGGFLFVTRIRCRGWKFM